MYSSLEFIFADAPIKYIQTLRATDALYTRVTSMYISRCDQQFTISVNSIVSGAFRVLSSQMITRLSLKVLQITGLRVLFFDKSDGETRLKCSNIRTKYATVNDMEAYLLTNNTRIQFKRPSPGFIPQHMFEKVTIQKDPSSDRVQYIVKTNAGEWTFDALDDVVFPRRPDGSSKYHQTMPIVKDIYPGDIVPAGPKGTTNSDGDEFLIVKNVTYGADRGAISVKADTTLISATSVNMHRNRTYEVPQNALFNPAFLEESIGIKKDTNLVAQSGRVVTNADAASKVEGLYGPFVNQQTGVLWVFMFHPDNRGRWPAEIKPYRSDMPIKLPQFAAEPYVGRWPADEWPDELAAATNRYVPCLTANKAKREIIKHQVKPWKKETPVR